MLLAIDTSTKIGSVTVIEGGAVVAERTLDAGKGHGVELAPAVASLSLDLSKLEAYAVTIGPGSFTGLRIALCFVKGLALVYPRPVVPISTLEVIARGIFDAYTEVGFALPMLDARRSEAYAALYLRSGGADPALADASYPIASIPDMVRARIGGARTIAAGDAVELFRDGDIPWEAAERRLSTPSGRILAELAWSRRAEAVGAASLEPRYLQLAPAEAPSGAAP